MKDRVSKKFWVGKDDLSLIDHGKQVGLSVNMMNERHGSYGQVEIEIFYNPPMKVREIFTEEDFDVIAKRFINSYQCLDNRDIPITHMLAGFKNKIFDY